MYRKGYFFMYGNFNEEAQTILMNSKKEMNEFKHPYVGTEHLMLSILKEDNNISRKLKEYKITYEKFSKEINKIVGVGTKKSELFLYTPLLKKVIDNAILISKDDNCNEVTIEHLFSSILEIGEGIAIRILIDMKINIEKLYDDFSSKTVKKKNHKNQELLVETLGENLTEKAKNNQLDPVVGREEEIKRILEILSRRTKNNPLLLGNAGVGKTAIVEAVASKIVNDEVPDKLKNKKIISLDMASLVAGTKYRGEFEERMKKILKEVNDNEDIILFIDEIHTLVGAGGAEGAIDASNILKPSLARGKIRCIGATTNEEYKRIIEKEEALNRRFQQIQIKEPSIEKTKTILLKLKPLYEEYHQVTIDTELINKIVELSNKYIYNRYQPDKSIDILDEVCANINLKENNDLKKINELKHKIKELSKLKNTYILENDFKKAYLLRKEETESLTKLNELELNIANNKPQVTLEDIARIINDKTGIPVYEILQDNVKVIKEIKNNLETHIIGQKESINELEKITKKIKLGYRNTNKCFSMLFTGKTGVGKTLLATTFGNALVGSDNVIKLDMSEYSESNSVNKIIGSPPGYVGYEENKNILTEVQTHPQALIILDEIEHAHPRVINLLYQILDTGRIKDNHGNTIRFDNNIIIMTSNVGASSQQLGFNDHQKDFIYSKLKEAFNTAFINRIDNILIFNELNEKDLKKIIKQKLTALNKKYPSLAININNKVIDEIIKHSKYQEYGARKIDKIIDNKIENRIIDSIINNEESINISSLEESVTI